jgi:hypothetical protein
MALLLPLWEASERRGHLDQRGALLRDCGAGQGPQTSSLWTWGKSMSVGAQP